MSGSRLAYRIATAAQLAVFLVWGLAIWRDWDGLAYYWLAFGAAMFVAQYLRWRVNSAEDRSVEGQRTP